VPVEEPSTASIGDMGSHISVTWPLSACSPDARMSKATLSCAAVE
jgi:hypothetical protein